MKSMHALLTAATVTLGLFSGGAAIAASTDGEKDGESKACPVSWSTLQSKLKTAVGNISSGFNNEMWAVVVNRDGIVCSVAFSGKSRNQQWLLSRQIAAAKAFTANGLSLDIDGSGTGPLSTAQLFPLVQPGNFLYGLAFGNPVDPAAAYKGPASKFGTSSDPMVGKRVGGTITFGGGVGLYSGGKKAVGGLGLSGDTACADDAIARELRTLLGLVPEADDAIAFGSNANEHANCPNNGG